MDGESSKVPKEESLSLAKSNSTKSAGSSTRSHVSIRGMGMHPLGTLRVLHPDGSIDETDEDMPPLDARSDDSTGSSLRAIRRFTSLHVSGKAYRRTTPEVLKHSGEGGDVVLILDLPEVFTVGYDTVSFTAKTFAGVRDIPAGPHFFWVSNPEGLSPRSGFWIQSSGFDHVHVIQWDAFNEILCEPSHAEARFQVEGLDKIHSQLPPYLELMAGKPVQGNKSHSAGQKMDKWLQLSRYVTEGVLNRILGRNGGNWLVYTGDRVSGSISSAHELELDRRLTGTFVQTQELNFAFEQLSRTFSTEQTGRDRTLGATDATPYIQASIDDPKSRLTVEQILGELQFAYVMGMHLGNDSCIQQWWHMLLKIVLRAYLLPARQPNLAAGLLRTLAAQLGYDIHWVDGSIFDNNELKANDLRLALTIYKRRLDELLSTLGKEASAEQVGVGHAFQSVEYAVIDLGWTLTGDYVRNGVHVFEDGEEAELETTELQDEDERGEYAPEVVEFDENGRQRDLVSWSN